MFTLSRALNSSQAAMYHKAEFTAMGQSYWQESLVAPSQWQGQLAEQFGLTGTVDEEAFQRLANGQHPGSGDQLVQHRVAHTYTDAAGKEVKSVEHRAGWDGTFSAPKSVSVTALVGGDERIRVAHREAIAVALQELEHYVHARLGGNTPALRTGSFVAASFEHDTARPVDGYAAPQLHTHVVVFNMTPVGDGVTRALQEKALFESQSFVTAIYQAELTYRLRQMGYEIEPGKSGAPDIKGYTADYLAASSPRSQQVKDYLDRMEAQGIQRTKAAERIAVLNTRDKKELKGPGEVRAAHRDLAEAYGNQPAQVMAAAQQRALSGSLIISEPSTKAHEAVTWARDHIFEREAVKDERTLLRDALRRGMGEVPYQAIRQNFDQRMETGEFKEAAISRYATARSITTSTMLRSENAILQMLYKGQDAMPPTATLQAAQAIIRSYPITLSTEQHAAVLDVVASRDRIQAIQGVAGAGKTTVLQVIKEIAEPERYTVQGLAPTSGAARQMYEAKIPSGTLQGFLASNGHLRADPTEKRLYFIDETTLASTRQILDFLKRLGPEDRVVVIEGKGQHQGVEAGRPIEQMMDAGMATAKLNEFRRQVDPELKGVVKLLSDGKVYLAVQALREQGRVTQIPDRSDRFLAIAADYARAPHGTIIVSPDNTSRRDINEAVRGELQRRGTLSTEGHVATILAPRGDMTKADRQWARQYHEDDVLKYRKGSASLGIVRGTYARIEATDERQNTIRVRFEDGRTVTYDPRRLSGASVYREREREFAVGDRLQFTEPSKALHVANRDLATVTRIEADGSYLLRTDRGKTVVLDPKAMRHFDHGYAVTSHSSQGMTVQRVLVNIDAETHPNLINMRLAYVSVSRAKLDARIYTHNADTLGHALSRDISKSSALPLHRELHHAAVQQQGFSMP